ncbi:MAG: hypothetical protein CMH52_05595 [Myxococcales bacterium]|nr:hypothetical protein [Myxococcales bacterium]|tara:strand:+ start:489 stop:1139 length:651 start_codon:yes stop_codon:yes gene_type:complete
MNELAPYARLGNSECGVIFDALMRIVNGPTLNSIFVNDLPVSQSEAADLMFAPLEELGFIRVNSAYTKQMRRINELRANAAQLQADLPSTERRLNTLGVQIKHAADLRTKKRLLKSKSKQWEEASRHETLEKERNELLKKRSAAMAAGQELRAFSEQVQYALNKDEASGRYVWIDRAARCLTEHGRILLAGIETVPEAHRHGRRLADVLTLGGLLV